jgi:hypothetical protein
MTTPPVGVERRVGQRFAFNLPVSVREVSTAAEGLGFTQDLSSRGAFFFTDMPLREGAEVELTLRMPSEITLGESMRVRCRGQVLRVVKAMDNSGVEAKSPESEPAETKIGVAVCLKGYEYLSETEDFSLGARRILALHHPGDTQRIEASEPESPPTAN